LHGSASDLLRREVQLMDEVGSTGYIPNLALKPATRSESCGQIIVAFAADLVSEDSRLVGREAVKVEPLIANNNVALDYIVLTVIDNGHFGIVSSKFTPHQVQEIATRQERDRHQRHHYPLHQYGLYGRGTHAFLHGEVWGYSGSCRYPGQPVAVVHC